MVLGGLASGCPELADSTEATTAVTSTTTQSSGDVDPPLTSTDTGTPVAWLEVGWGTTEFNAFDESLPVVIGPQGLSMFSMPIRGGGFYNPPDPSFDNPDMPMLHAWVEIEGYELSEGGYFNEVVDYPALFYPSLDNDGILEGPAVWLVLPNQVDPLEIVGRTAFLRAELVDRDGLVLVDEYELVVGGP